MVSYSIFDKRIHTLEIDINIYKDNIYIVNRNIDIAHNSIHLIQHNLINLRNAAQGGRLLDSTDEVYNK